MPVQICGDTITHEVGEHLARLDQERIERSLAGEKLPGCYPLGEAPFPLW